MASNVYETVLQATAQEQVTIFQGIEWERGFLHSTLFDREVIFRTTSIQADYRKASRRLAPLVGKYQYGRVLLDSDSVSQLVQLPSFGPTRILRADDFLGGLQGCGFMAPGGTDYATRVIARNWEEMELSHVCREEFMCSELLQRGKIIITGDAVDSPNEPPGTVTLQFEINPPIDTPWDTSGNLVGWLNTAARTLASKSGSRPNCLILGANAASAFMADASVMRERELLSNIADTRPEIEGAGVQYLGTFSSIDVYEYDQIFIQTLKGDDDKFHDVVKPLIDDNAAILADTNAMGSFAYGAIAVSEQRQIVTIAAKRIPNSWNDAGNQTWYQRISSRYCPIPADTSSWQVFSNVVGSTPPEPPETQAHAHGSAAPEPHKNAKK